jgi:ribosome-associated toxin RatA of RatAB toxin-antitoxin module
MPQLQRSALLPHSANDMFDLVLDVAAYPEFLPWCSAARVLERSETHQVAAVTIAKAVKRSEFKTQNQLERPGRIEMRLVDGPFRKLTGSWQFTAIDEQACRAELNVDFEFGNPIVGRLILPAFKQVCDSLVGAFTRRAAAVYSGGRLQR